jgi:hypothetical protein
MKKRFAFLLTVLIEVLYTLSNVTVQSQLIDFTCVANRKYAYNACTQYVECVDAGTQYARAYLRLCSSGTLFDTISQDCVLASTVTCDSGSATTAVTTSLITASTISPDILQQTTTCKYKLQVFVVK